jgi:hypothetical protein
MLDVAKIFSSSLNYESPSDIDFICNNPEEDPKTKKKKKSSVVWHANSDFLSLRVYFNFTMVRIIKIKIKKTETILWVVALDPTVMEEEYIYYLRNMTIYKALTNDTQTIDYKFIIYVSNYSTKKIKTGKVNKVLMKPKN